MKCIFCPNVIDEASDHTDRGGILVPTAGELQNWNQLKVTTHAGGELVLFQGHACPSHNLQGDSLSLSFRYEAPPADVTTEATEVPALPPPLVAPADDVRVRAR